MNPFFPHKKEINFDDPEWERQQIEKAKANPQAFGPLYEKYHKRIFFYIRKKIGRTEEAEDITAAIFEKAIKNLTKFQWQGIPLSSWLYRIARNALNDYLRSIQTNKFETSNEDALEQAEDKADDALEIMIKDELQEEALKAIAKLNETDQYIVYYKFFEGLSNIKIAETLGMTETNIGTRLNRLKERLKKFVD
jgi:RNA polymerase sigma-70 factor, ECF subfamily